MFRVIVFILSLLIVGQAGAQHPSVSVKKNSRCQELPDAGFTVNNAEQKLADNHFEFLAKLPLEGEVHIWEISGEIYSVVDLNKTFDAPGIYRVAHFVTNQEGCSNSEFILVEVLTDQPQVAENGCK